MPRRPLDQVYMPIGAHSVPRGMLLGLCGLGEFGEMMRGDSGYDKVAEENNCVAAYPNAFDRNWVERPNFWADRDTEYLNGVIDSYVPAIGRRFAVGVSDGGCKLLVDADRLHIDRIVAYAGYLMAGTRDLLKVSDTGRKLRVLFIRGREDGLVSYSQVKQAQDAFDAAGHSTTFIEASGGHTQSGSIKFFYDSAMLPVVSEFFLSP